MLRGLFSTRPTSQPTARATEETVSGERSRMAALPASFRIRALPSPRLIEPTKNVSAGVRG